MKGNATRRYKLTNLANRKTRQDKTRHYATVVLFGDVVIRVAIVRYHDGISVGMLVGSLVGRTVGVDDGAYEGRPEGFGVGLDDG